MSQPTTSTTADESTSNKPVRVELTLEFNRPICHPCDDVGRIRALILGPYRKFTHGLPATDVEPQAGVATAVLEVSDIEAFSGISKSHSHLHRRLQQGYSRDGDRHGPRPRASPGDGKPESVVAESVEHEERVEAEYEPLTGVAPYDAPDLRVETTHVRTLEGAPASIDADRFGGDSR